MGRRSRTRLTKFGCNSSKVSTRLIVVEKRNRAGCSNPNFIHGNQGRDDVNGGFGPDRIFLGNGDDNFTDTPQVGAAGSDTITGGNGGDSFVFTERLGHDVITDFERGEDTLVLSRDLVGGRTRAQVVQDLVEIEVGNIVFDFGGILLDLDYSYYGLKS